MKDYKQKYEQAIARMNKWVEGSEIIDPKEVAEFVFPELCESEYERIRKALIHYFSEQDGILTAIDGGVRVKDILAWLEKQDPKKHEEELERAYKCADEVQYRKGYEDAKREFEKQGEILKIIKHKEAMLDCQTCANYKNECFPDRNIFKCSYPEKNPQDLDEKQGEQKPNFCHHEVDLSDCSEEYRRAYYDGWNNCNQQHAQLEAEQKPINGEYIFKSIPQLIEMLSPSDKVRWACKELVKSLHKEGYGADAKAVSIALDKIYDKKMDMAIMDKQNI